MKKFLRALLSGFLCPVLAFFSFSVSAADAGVVLALSGGGTRGFAHVGVIEVLEEQGIPVVGIVGTSIGSLIGALNASGYNAKALREIVSELDMASLLSENTGPMFVFTGDDQHAKTHTIPALTYKQYVSKRGGPLGILTGDRLFQYFTQLMRHVEITDFSELPIPYAAVAADIQTGEKIVLRSGSLPSAMRASMSIPALFEPWEIDEHILVDGGVVSNLPIDTAKELFPGFPVVGVDVSDIPSKERPIGSLVDIVDQSFTILMRQRTAQEMQRADLIITPNVQEFSFLDDKAANAIIQRGKEAALSRLDQIKALSESSPAVKKTPPSDSSPLIIRDVVIHGLPESLSGRLRKSFLRWVGKPLDAEEVRESIAYLTETPDIATVDYSLQRVEPRPDPDKPEAILVIDVRRLPDLEVGASGYTTNLDPYRWLYLKGTARGVFDDLDSLRGGIRMGEQWGVDLTYLTAPEPLTSWEFNLAAQNWEVDTWDAQRQWERYALGAQRLFHVGKVSMGLGLAAEHVEGSVNSDFVGPTFFAAYDTLDIPADPTQGQAWRINAWWPNADELLYRLTYFKPFQTGDMWRTYLRLGYLEGDLAEEGHAAYLGAAEELYSVASRPVEAERMLWANLAVRRVLKRSVLGIVAAEIFVSYGYAMDRDYGKIAAPWEVGLTFSIPNNLIDMKLAAMYGSEDFKIGFFLGVPMWDHYPLP